MKKVIIEFKSGKKRIVEADMISYYGNTTVLIKGTTEFTLFNSELKTIEVIDV